MATKKNTTVKNPYGNEYDYFRITRTVGHEWKNGRKVPIKKQFTGTSKGNAEQKYKEYLENRVQIDKERQTFIESEKHRTFGDLAEEFTYNDFMNSSEYASSTKRRYEQSYRTHIKDSFIMSIPINEVKARTIQDCYMSLDVTKQNLKSITKWMAAFYKWLVLNDISDNVLPAVTLPVKPDNTRHDDIIVWEPDEIQAILTHSDGHRLRFMMFLMNYAGLRISECFGLKYSDMKNGVISINRQCYEGEIGPPKHNSYRKIPMHQELIKALKVHKEWHEKEMLRRKYNTEYVFTTQNGNLLEYGNARRALLRYYKRHGIPEKNPHVYRSTFCTELCRHGVPLEVASKLMGHKSVEVTAKHYALIKEDTQINAINTLPGISNEPVNAFKVKKAGKKIRRLR